MKKILLLIAVSFALLTISTAQITQQQADSIVLERLNCETQPYTLHAKASVQEDGYTITTSQEEVFELDYTCWVYWVRYSEEMNSNYLIIKENNGSLLEIELTDNEGPDDLDEWRTVIDESDYPIEIPFTEYSPTGSICQWITPNMTGYSSNLIIINSHEELENYKCQGGNYPEIDFSKHTLLLAYGREPYRVTPNYKSLQQLSAQNYVMKVNINPGFSPVVTHWWTPIVVSKIVEDAHIELIVTKNT